MTRSACPTDVELTRALSMGADASTAAHLAGCARCRRASEGLAETRRLARGLATHVPSASKREELRAALLATAERSPVAGRRGVVWMGGAAVLGAAAVAALWIGHPRGAPPVAARSHAAVHAAADARYAIIAPPPAEILRLWEGALELEVSPLGPGDSFRVQVGDGEVEVRGTKFDVVARADRLVGVDVSRGRVEVRAPGAPLAVLGAGQVWRAPIEAAPKAAPPPAPSIARDAPSRPRRVAMTASPAVERALRPTRQEALYDDAWDALRARDFQKAAAGFARVLAESPSGPLADEAAFWRATSLARGGEPRGAIAAFRDLIATYPESPRRSEASAILGWLLVDAHQPAEASRRFRAAAADPRETVRASAREGLEALAPHDGP